MKTLFIKLLAGVALATALGGALTACNTIAGMGEDVSAAGRGVTRGAETTKQRM